MIISAGDSGWSAHCFRCGDGFKPYPAPSLQERMDLLKKQEQKDTAASASMRLPDMRNAVLDPTQWPLNAKVWLYKAGFSAPEIQRHGWYWSPDLARVVLPVVANGEVVFWQARNCQKDGRPKYLAPDVPKGSIVAAYGTGDKLVLTEDILSAAKVGRVTEAWSIMGTGFSARIFSRVVATGKSVCVWLDPDDAGRTAAASITNTLRSVGVAVSNVESERDPKLHCTEEIEHVLSSCTFHCS